MNEPGSLQFSVILGCIAALLLIVALVLKKVSSKEEPSRPVEDLLKKPVHTTNSTANSHVVAPLTTQTASASTQTAVTAQASQAVVSTAAASTESIDWQESDDVYRPTPVEAAKFVHSLGMPHPPQVQGQQVYIFIRRPIYEQIRTHLKKDTRIEHGGLLFGEAHFDPALATYLILVEAATPAIGAHAGPGSITYTPEAWQKIMPQMQQMDPAWTVIGSYHSHPGMGVFMSETDKATQAEVFAQDWQIALVIDPISDEIGFFAGSSGEPCPEWYLLTAERQLVTEN